MMRQGILLLSCIIVLVPIFAVWADSLGVELVGRLPFIRGPIYDVYTVGDYAYLCAGSGLAILDISDPAILRIAGVYNTGARGVHVVGGYAYVAGGGEGLRVIDVSDPTDPNAVGFSDTPGDALGVHVADGYAYVADGDSGLRVIDISNPTNPRAVGIGNTSGYACGVYIAGGYAYVAAEDSGLRVIDVSDPTNPYEVGFYITPYDASGVYVVGGYAYVTDEDGLLVIDVSDPSNPHEVGFCDTPGGAVGVHVAEGYAYVADWDSGLRVIDISDPTSPREVGFYDTPSHANGVHVDGNYAYIAGSDGLDVVNVSDPSIPTEVGFYNTTSGYAEAVHVVGTHAYVAAGNSGLRVIDVSDPLNPRAVGVCDIPSDAKEVYVAGNYAYVADGGRGLQVIDISDPENPYDVGFYDLHGWTVEVHVSGRYAYVAGSEGICVIDVSDPTNPWKVGVCDTVRYELGAHVVIHVVGGYAYVAGGHASMSGAWGGFWIIDVSNPLDPEEVGFYDTPAFGVHMVGGYAYVAGHDGLWIIDASDPTNPREVGSCHVASDAIGVHVVGGYAYVADYWRGLRVIDISDPTSPHEVGFYDIPNLVYGVYVAGGYAYLTAGEGGLYILRYADAVPSDDDIPPAAVMDLSASASGVGNQIDLQWTAPGDDVNIGTATSYIVRYNTIPITGSNWDKSSDVDGEPTPGSAGSMEGITVTMPYASAVYYFAIKTQDEVPNTSGISNSPYARSPIQLYTGWNMVAFILPDAMPIAAAMSRVDGKYTSVWTYDASTANWLRYIVGGPSFLNNLDDMWPGYGYWIQVKEDCAWDFGGSGVASPPALAMRKPPFLLYGKITEDDRTVTSSDGSNVSLEVKDVRAGSYVLGSERQYEDYYVLEIAVDGSFHEGDAAQLYVDDMLAQGDAVNLGGVGVIRRHDISYTRTPKFTKLFQNYPNPFNPETWIPYQLTEDSQVTIRIYSVTGQLIKLLDLGYRGTGVYTTKDAAAYWDGTTDSGERVSSGVHFYTIEAGDFSATRKMVVRK